MNAPSTISAEPYADRWRMMAVLLIAGFMNLIDVTIVNVALPSLQRGLGATESEIEWIVAAYILAFAIGLLPFGRLGDRIGRRRMFIAGVAGFTIASALCGLAPSIEFLIAARVVQGVAGAMMMPQVLAIAQVTFPPQERGLAFSLFGLSAGLASVAGPLVGGALIDANIAGLDWRPIFLVNVPVGIFAILAALRFVPNLPGDRSIGNDAVGTILAGGSVFLVVFALIEGRGFGWPLWIFALIALALVGIFLFTRYEASLAKAGRDQLLPVKFLGYRNFVLGALMIMIFFSGMAGFFMVLAVFLQNGFGYSALHSGLTTFPFPAGVLAVSFLNGRLGNNWTRQRVAAGASTLVLAMGWLLYEVSQIGGTVEPLRFSAPLFFAGLGLGATISALFQTALFGMPPRDAGSASGALQSFQQIGGALGVAIAGQIFFSMVAAGFADGSGQPAAFQAGLEGALIYEMVAFGLVALLVLFLNPQAPQADHRAAEPVAVEA